MSPNGIKYRYTSSHIIKAKYKGTFLTKYNKGEKVEF